MFIKIRIIDVVDVLLVAILLYQIYNLVKGSAALNIFFGIIIIYSVYLLVDVLQMRLLSQILGQFIGVGVIILVVLFQQEIRKFLLLLGNNRFKFFKNILPRSGNPEMVDTEQLKQAVEELIAYRTGALIVFMKNSELKYYLKTGVPIDAKLTSQMVHSIFFKNSPLHDGAIFVKGSVIRAARCILPLTEKNVFPEHLGLRHRAALGITELSDAVAVVVSEQNQQISVAYNGKLDVNLKVDEMIVAVEKYLSQQ